MFRFFARRTCSSRSILTIPTLTIGILCVTNVVCANDDLDFFERNIRPLLIRRCHSCHSAATGKTRGGLALDSRKGWRTGGDSGSAIVPGEPDASLLIRAVRYGEDGPQMPPAEKGGRLPEAEIAALVEWVRLGAPAPRSDDTRIGGMTLSEARGWWSFQPITAAKPPKVAETAWPKNSIDLFVLSQMEARGLDHAPQADRRTLIRRATFDLTGLPPTPDQVTSFLEDPSMVAFERVVDRLLNSPAYGQRWARHWLDVVRYADYYDADASARQMTAEPLDAWRYRDWVVDSINQDLPFDQFVVHQIAGDLLPSRRGGEVYAPGLIATTFLSNGVWDPHDADKEKIVSDIVDDNIDTIGKAFLGLTLGCARCHDHKFDPISTEDYYGLAGIFYSSHILTELGTKGGAYTMNRVPLVPQAVVAKRNEQLKQLKEFKSKLTELDQRSPPPGENDPRRLQFVARVQELEQLVQPELPRAIAVQEGGTPGGLFPSIQDVPIHFRGSYTRLGQVVPRRVPGFLAGGTHSPIRSGSGRRELADWIASSANPLTARVIVNRIWQWHFGEGIVRTSNNFGKLGEAPTHGRLLDWLAAKLIEEGWSIKQLHRRILLSASYQQSHWTSAVNSAQDEENRWLGRFASRRLEAEAFRDAILCVSGVLDSSLGGPAGDDFTIRRRSLYVQTARWKRSSYAILFDAANPDSSTERRTVSTIAPQALLLLNHPFMLEHAKHLADRLLRDVPSNESARIDRAYRLLFARPATKDEIGIARQILASGGNSAWEDLAHVLLCSNEFAYLD